MKLNYDCIKDILLYLEENLKYGSGHKIIPISSIKLIEELNYPEDDIRYSLFQLASRRYINIGTSLNIDENFQRIDITSLTWEGHEFLKNLN